MGVPGAVPTPLTMQMAAANPLPRPPLVPPKHAVPAKPLPSSSSSQLSLLSQCPPAPPSPAPRPPVHNSPTATTHDATYNFSRNRAGSHGSPKPSRNRLESYNSTTPSQHGNGGYDSTNPSSRNRTDSCDSTNPTGRNRTDSSGRRESLPLTPALPSPSSSSFSSSPSTAQLQGSSNLYCPSKVCSPAPLYPSHPALLAEGGDAKGVAHLERGLVVTVFSLKRRPEKMHLMASPELSLVQCVRSIKHRPEITVDLAHVQEIRCGRRCADFDKWSEEANKEKNELCLVIFYGVEALPQALAIAARNQDDFSHVLSGVTYLVEAVHNQTYQAQRQRWFKRQFHGIVCTTPGVRKTDDKQEKMTVKQLRQWLLKNGLKANKKDIMPVIHQLCLSDTLKYGSFVMVLTELMTAHSVTIRMKPYTVTYNGVLSLIPATFLKFLKQEQNEVKCTEVEAQALLDQYLEGKENVMTVPSSKVLDLTEFEEFLFSPLNSVVRPEAFTVHQDMTRPLTEYWISSSHNTYLAGHQFFGFSSEQMYARCLRMGCRCLELDCFDGSDGEPVITHGKTFVSKIKVSDVLKVIKENAWQTSEYPIILSIENHLSLPQQRYLAGLFQDIFKDELLTEPIDPKEIAMPSPEQLKRKIIIKDKKLKKTDTGGSDVEDVQGQKDSNMTGTLMMKDSDDQTWYPVTVGLTDTAIFYTNDKGDDDDIEDAEEDIDYDEYFHEVESDEDEDDLTYQPWYYADLVKRDVKRLLKGENSGGGRFRLRPRQPHSQSYQDGAFLVRKSEGGGKSGDNYSLSFIWEGEVKHVRVKTKEENGTTLYTFGNEVWQHSIVKLVDYFRNHHLYIANEKNHMKLDKPVCKPHEEIHERWFRPDMDRYTSERLLLRIQKEGVFLVRGSSDPGCLCLSFRHKHKISHFQIAKRGKSYVCGNYRFVSLPKMVDYFRRRPLYRKTKLTEAATEDMAGCDVDEECGIYDIAIYNDPFEVEQFKTVAVRALYDFMGRAAENEMSFTRGAIITNVREEDKPWWKGDYMEQKQKAFPASYVQVISEKEDMARKQSVCDILRGKDSLELADCTLDNGPYKESNVNNCSELYCFHVEHPRYKPFLELGCESLLMLQDWVVAIRDRQRQLEVWNREQQKQEKILKRARELSEQIIYCQAVNYDPSGSGRYYNVSSLAEDKVNVNDEALLKVSRQQLLRVYPKAKRFDSSNFDPVPRWTCGAHMVALNYQTPGLPMQLNQARFLTNGRCGYVLKPSFMRDHLYNQTDILNHRVPTEVHFLTVTVLAGRILCPEGRMMGVVRPFVVVEVIGLPMDNASQRTKAVDEDNGLKPQWFEERMKFDVSCPELAFLRFEVLSETNDNKTVIAQATFPVTALRQGYRSVPLQNGFSENLDMSALLVHIDIKNPKDAEEENLFRVLEESRRYRAELIRKSATGDSRSDQISAELLKTEMNILSYLQNRHGKDPSRDTR